MGPLDTALATRPEMPESWHAQAVGTACLSMFPDAMPNHKLHSVRLGEQKHQEQASASGLRLSVVGLMRLDTLILRHQGLLELPTFRLITLDFCLRSS